MIADNLTKIKAELPENVSLVAVSKFHPKESILQIYNAGQRIFAESRPQELVEKHQQLPNDIEWHFIGHLQTNKIKLIIPFISLIHSVDSQKLAQTISHEAAKIGRTVDILLQVHIAQEQTKQGFSISEVENIMKNSTFAAYNGIRIVGLMGMATYTDNTEQIRKEFEKLREIYEKYNFSVLSMGMSEDYPVAIECGSNMIRIGSSIFGHREY